MIDMKNSAKHFFVVSGVTFAVFFMEALIHYNYGILESRNLKFSWDTIKEDWTMPKGKNLLKMASIVLVASTLSGMIIKKVDESVQ